MSSAFKDLRGTMEFVNEMGKVFCEAGTCGVKSVAAGKVLALHILTQEISPYEADSKINIIKNKVSVRPDAMLGALIDDGGSYKWIKSGDDGVAELMIDYKGNKTQTSFSMEDAKRANLTKGGGAWTTFPDAMLRARVTSKLMRMAAPNIVGGVYTPDELGEEDEPKEEATGRTPEEVAARKAEIQKRRAETVQEAAPEKTEPASKPEKKADPKKPAAKKASKKKEEAKKDTKKTGVVNEPPQVGPAGDNVKIDHAAALLSLEEVLKTGNADLVKFHAALVAKNPDTKSFEEMEGEEIQALENRLREKWGMETDESTPF